MEALVYHPTHAPKPPFETERLVMRPFVDEDAEIVHASLDTDPEVWRFDPGHERSLDERREVIMRFTMLHRQFGFGPCGAWGKDGTFIGQGGLNPYLYDHRDGTRTVEFEVMYKIARPFWRQGYATEIARFWVGCAFTQIRLPRLFVAPARANAGSVGVLRALGASFEDDWLDENAVIASLYPPDKAGRD